jgi:hypothetical protein
MSPQRGDFPFANPRFIASLQSPSAAPPRREAIAWGLAALSFLFLLVLGFARLRSAADLPGQHLRLRSSRRNPLLSSPTILPFPRMDNGSLL